MDKIREKPQATSSIREKITAAPKELVHRGLEDGADHLRTQLRDAAQQGRRDDHGGDQIEDTTADSMRRMERGAEKLIKEKRKNRASRGGNPTDPAAGRRLYLPDLGQLLRRWNPAGAQPGNQHR